jgi:hypothetical protein
MQFIDIKYVLEVLFTLTYFFFFFFFAMGQYLGSWLVKLGQILTKDGLIILNFLEICYLIFK